MRRLHPLSHENRKRILHGLQSAADAGNVPAAEALVRLSLLKELGSKEQHNTSTGAVMAAPGQAVAP